MKKNIFITFFILGAFLCFPLEIGFSTANLWQEDSGKSVFFDAYFQDSFVGEEETVEVKANIKNIHSSLEFFSENLIISNIDLRLEKDFFKSESKILVYNLEDFALKLDKKNFILTNSLNGYVLYQSFDINLKNMSISPYGFYSESSLVDGKFYWFNGQVDIPLICGFGLNLKIGKNHFHVMKGNAGVEFYNEKTESLGNVTGKLFYIDYFRDVNIGDFDFSSGFGYGYFGGYLSLTLNQDNQKYLAFPYVFYECEGEYLANYLRLCLNAKYSKRNFDININTQGWISLNQIGNANLNWKYKKNFLFDGSSGSENHFFDDDKKVHLIIVDIKSTYIFGESLPHWKIELSKPFIVPISRDFEPDNINRELIKSWLMSGLKIGITARF